MKSGLRIAGAAAIALYSLTRFAIALAGLDVTFGAAWALAAAAALLLLGWMLPVRVGALIGAATLWHWPWLLALLWAAPRLLLVCPGLLTTLRARYAHPRPLWHASALAAALPAAAVGQGTVGSERGAQEASR